MGTETMDYAEEEVLTETGIETLTEALTEASTEALTETSAGALTETLAGALTETSAGALTETSAEALTEGQAEVLEEMETPAFKEDEEIPSSELSPDLSDPFKEMEVFTYSETEEDVVFDWQEDLSACRASLDSLVSLLLFGDIALCLLLDCLCASIFSAFWKVNR